MKVVMKAVVLYRSIYGFTKIYAQWIAEELGTDLLDGREIEPQALIGFNLIIFGGSLDNGRINGIDIIKHNFAALAGKRIIIFATGGAQAREGITGEILAANFSEKQQKLLRLFYLRGSFDFSKLGAKDKILIICWKWWLQMKRIEDLRPVDKDLLAAYANPVNGMNKDNIRTLVDYARS